jgi:hypothetical protein
VLQLALVYVEPLHGVFETATLGPVELAIVLAASTTGFVAVELEKLAWRRGWWPGQRPDPEPRS